jgi:hypothetical protein
MARSIPDACTIEIIERSTAAVTVGSLIVPNEIRINGVPVLAAAEPIEVHAIKMGAGDIVRVTLTLFARRVTIGAENDIETA